MGLPLDHVHDLIYYYLSPKVPPTIAIIMNFGGEICTAQKFGGRHFHYGRY